MNNDPRLRDLMITRQQLLVLSRAFVGLENGCRCLKSLAEIEKQIKVNLMNWAKDSRN